MIKILKLNCNNCSWKSMTKGEFITEMAIWRNVDTLTREIDDDILFKFLSFCHKTKLLKCSAFRNFYHGHLCVHYIIWDEDRISIEEIQNIRQGRAYVNRSTNKDNMIKSYIRDRKIDEMAIPSLLYTQQ